jgi:hypothetical protein
VSGWIQLDKDLREDVRVQRMARALVTRGDVTQLRYKTRAAVTLVLGGLAQLWMHADAFARNDNALEITSDEIDELTGIEGFAQLLPSDWLKILDAQRVELPGFQEHNGTTAKSRALTNRRVARFRAKSGNAGTTPSVSDCNGEALPDQTIPDHTRPKSRRAARTRATRLPDDFTLTPARSEIAKGESLDPERTFAKFCDYWRAAGGDRARKVDWEATWRNWCRTEADRPRSLPSGGKPRGPTAEETERESLRKLTARRAAIGLAQFREPHHGETSEQYRAAQDAAYNARERERTEPVRLDSVRELAAAKRMPT